MALYNTSKNGTFCLGARVTRHVEGKTVLREEIASLIIVGLSRYRLLCGCSRDARLRLGAMFETEVCCTEPEAKVPYLKKTVCLVI